MKRLWVIFLLAFVLRAGWGLTRSPDLSALPDQQEYLSLGRNLLSGAGLMFTDDRFGTPVYAFRTPGYPFFLAALGGNLTVIRLTQAALDASLVFAVYLLARPFLGFRSWLPSLFVALNPFLIFFSGLILTETLFTALLVWGTVLLFPFPKSWAPDAISPASLSTGTKTFLLGLVILAVSVLIRPGALVLPTLIATVAAMSRPRLPRFPAAFTAALLTFLVLFPWAYRNHIVLNEWVFTSTNAGVTAYDGFNPAADGSSNQATFLPHFPELSQMTETQRNDYLLQLASAYRKENPDRLLPLTLAKAARTWSPVPLSSENQSPLTVTLSLAYYIPLWLLAILGLSQWKNAFGLKTLMLLPAIYLTIAAASSVGSLRYRIPADPFIAVLAGLGATVLSAPKQPNSQPSV